MSCTRAGSGILRESRRKSGDGVEDLLFGMHEMSSSQFFEIGNLTRQKADYTLSKKSSE